MERLLWFLSLLTSPFGLSLSKLRESFDKLRMNGIVSQNEVRHRTQETAYMHSQGRPVINREVKSGAPFHPGGGGKGRGDRGGIQNL